MSSQYGLLPADWHSDSGVLVAPSIHTLDSDRRLMVRCLNCSTIPVTLPAGSRLAKFLTFVPKQISQQLMRQPQSVVAVLCTKTEMGPVPAHLENLYERALAACPQLDSSRRTVHRLLCDYADVFSKDSSDSGSITLMQCSIPVAPETKPIRHAPHRLGPENEAEVKKQIQQLQNQGMI